MLSLILIAALSFAGPCDFFAETVKLGLSDNEDFWAEIAPILDRNEMTEKSFREIAEKHLDRQKKSDQSVAGDNTSDGTTAKRVIPEILVSDRFATNNRAIDDFKSLQPASQQKLNDFIKFASEKKRSSTELKNSIFEFKFIKEKKYWAVRLDDGNRAKIEWDKDNYTFKILEIGNNWYRH
jgi:hypothetical protein